MSTYFSELEGTFPGYGNGTMVVLVDGSGAENAFFIDQVSRKEIVINLDLYQEYKEQYRSLQTLRKD